MDPCLTLELSLSKLQLPYGINNLSLTIRITELYTYTDQRSEYMLFTDSKLLSK